MTTWTETPPTKTGYYWWRDRDSGWHEQPVDVFANLSGRLFLQRFGCLPKPLYGEWGLEVVLPDELKGGK